MKFAGSYGVPLEEISRESFFNIGGPHGFMRWGLYIFMFIAFFYLCLLYTSDAADDLLCVDLGGRRIIKKKTILIMTPCLNYI